jgi:O-antigen ligase
MWTMNVAGYVLGGLLAAKLGIRWVRGYRPARWEEARSTRLISVLAGVTIAILAYCLISAVNARFTYNPVGLSFKEHKLYVNWLPHSFDSGRTWFAFWCYLGLACSFWAVRDSMLGKTGVEVRKGGEGRGERGERGEFFPGRLRRLLWVLAINGALLGLEGIVQRLEGSGKLLFLVKPRVNPEALAQFGPYAYRANAAHYFNLLWPVCLGFWWTLNRSGGFKRKGHYVLLACSAVMAACPIISTSRGGALISVGIAVLGAVLLLGSQLVLKQRKQLRRAGLWALALLAVCLLGGLALGYVLGWKALKPRMNQLSEGFEGREEMYAAARPMARDYPIFGTGPGTFESVFQLYRISTETYWPAQLHNDWLETRITFGWVGSGLIGVAFLTVILRWFTRGGIHGGRRFMIFMWLALGGCLVHARYDFPFQIYSIVFLFLVLCAVMSNLTKRAGRGERGE